MLFHCSSLNIIDFRNLNEKLKHYYLIYKNIKQQTEAISQRTKTNFMLPGQADYKLNPAHLTTTICQRSHCYLYTEELVAFRVRNHLLEEIKIEYWYLWHALSVQNTCTDLVVSFSKFNEIVKRSDYQTVVAWVLQVLSGR